MSLYSCKRRVCYHQAAESQVSLPVPLPLSWLSPHGTFCDKCRGRAAWLSCPPAAAPPGRSRTRQRPWSAHHLGGEDRAAVRLGPPQHSPPRDGREPRVTAAGAAGMAWNCNSAGKRCPEAHVEAQGGHGCWASGVNTILTPGFQKNHQPVGGEHHSHTSSQERGETLELAAQCSAL